VIIHLFLIFSRERPRERAAGRSAPVRLLILPYYFLKSPEGHFEVIKKIDRLRERPI
jgi:hypothetical protein